MIALPAGERKSRRLVSPSLAHGQVTPGILSSSQPSPGLFMSAAPPHLPYPRFAQGFTEAFAADPVTGNYSRQVSNALYSRVAPTPTSAPRTLLWSPELADACGFDADFCRSQEFARVFSGNALLPGMVPHATRYGGHQFGHWAGQLGDGRAINLGEVALESGERWAFQLKGAGPTPYSRGADGRAVLRSSVREFLCSEAMHYLGIPTTRAFSLVLTGDSVMRDMFYDGNPQQEPGAVVCRLAPSFTRFGHFELCARKGELPLLEQLVDRTIAVDFPHLQRLLEQGDCSVQELRVLWFEEVCARTAMVIIEWMRVGFVHGVMNTDNMSILGLTIDYGPYGWLDNYDPEWTPNTTDAQGRRYRFGHQPVIAQWNLYQLATALLPVIDDKAALESALTRFAAQYESGWTAMMGRKLGLNLQGNKQVAEDEALLSGLDDIMRFHETDMTLFYRLLPHFGGQSDAALSSVVAEAFYSPEALTDEGRSRIDAWGRDYAQRIRQEAMPAGLRRERMNAANPCYVLRNYLAQEAIDLALEGDYSMLEDLYRMLRRPYDAQPEFARFARKRPEWARSRAGCSMLSCSS